VGFLRHVEDVAEALDGNVGLLEFHLHLATLADTRWCVNPVKDCKRGIPAASTRL
jgi:hypothetical protein